MSTFCERGYLATSVEDGQPTPQMWTREAGKGRVFVAIPGHYNWTFDDPLARVLILRGMDFGLSPALRASRAELTPALKRDGGGGRERSRTQRFLISGQLAGLCFGSFV